MKDLLTVIIFVSIVAACGFMVGYEKGSVPKPCPKCNEHETNILLLRREIEVLGGCNECF